MGNSCLAGAPKVSRPAILGKTHDPTFEWRVHGFSALLESGAMYSYSAIFHCSGYKWYLAMNPLHKISGDGIPYIALNLCLSRVGFKPGYIVNVVFELSMYNHCSGTYCGYKASYNFHIKKMHSENMCMIPLGELLKSSDFMDDDTCVFGVRILKADVPSFEKKPVVITKKPIIVQNIFLQKKGFNEGTYIWTTNNFLDLKLPILSPAFEIGGHKWYIMMHPLGDKYSTKSLSLYLHLNDPKQLSDPESGMMIKLSLSILDQKHGQHFTISGRFPFATGCNFGWGWCDFIHLKTLKDPLRGFLVGSNCILKADITIIGSSSDGY